MKKIICQIFMLLIFSNLINAQVNSNLPPQSTYKPSINALLLLASYDNIAESHNVRVCDQELNIKSVSSAMPEKGYGTLVSKGNIVTFTSYYYQDGDPNVFHTIWGKDSSEFLYYGACIPRPIVFHMPPIAANDVFEALLIDITKYTPVPDENYLTIKSSSGVIQPANIKKIVNEYVDPETSTVATSDPADYKNHYSSVGIIVNVQLKNDSYIKCYLINNYDATGTLIWKDDNSIH